MELMLAWAWSAIVLLGFKILHFVKCIQWKVFIFHQSEFIEWTFFKKLAKLHMLIVALLIFWLFFNSQMYFCEGGLAPSSQIIGSLLRLPCQLQNWS